MNKPKHIVFVNTGESPYNQGKVPLETAFDLTLRGEEKIYELTAILGDRFGKDEVVHLISSPYGRALHTAKAIVPARDFTLHVHGKGATIFDRTIRIIPDLEEMRGYDPFLVRALVFGGDAVVDNIVVQYERPRTNPYGLSFNKFFSAKGWLYVDKDYLNQRGVNVLGKFMHIETSLAMRDRMKGCIQSYIADVSSDVPWSIIAISHEDPIKALAGKVVGPSGFVVMTPDAFGI
ncbi:histidine phosphatase family protein [bacterium]|nr:histidine phosphatase family protein [bacterium]